MQDNSARAVYAFTVCNGPVCAQHGCEYDVVWTAVTSTDVGVELHRSEEKKRGNMGHLSSRKPGVVVGACRTINIMVRLVKV